MYISRKVYKSNQAARFGLVTLCFFILASMPLVAQERTDVQGKVTDAQTGEALPFVQVSFKGTAIGTVTDIDGRFTLGADASYNTLALRMMGYEPLEVELAGEKSKRGLKITMVPQTKVLEVVTISSKRTRRRYSRHNNPAVDLAEQVIAHRDSNRLERHDQYRRKVYEKLTLALDDFHPDFQKHKFWKHLKFVQKYIDQAPFDAKPILTVSMRETMMEQTYRRKPLQQRTLVTGYRMEGVDQALSQEGFDESLNDMFTHFDIYDADIELMLNHFVGPLSPTLATTFYHFYITDTVEVQGIRCVELSFAPSNKESFGFTGHMYVTLDGSYRVQKYTMSVRRWVNINYVRDLTVEQQYDRMPDGSYVPGRQDVYCRLYLHMKLQQLYAHRVSVCTDYDFSPDAEPLPDSLFGPMVHTAMLPNATKIRRRVWNSTRPIELTFKETMIDSLRFELARLPWFRTLKTIGEVTFTNYAPTSSIRDSRKVDIGPVFNFISYNHEEGWRLRLGGITTARLNPRHFFEGYVAYGFGDRRPKFSASYLYAFDPKRRHAHEAPHSRLQLLASYDMVAPGQSFGNFTRDNLFVSSDVPRKTQYEGTAAIRLQKQWKSPLALDTWLSLKSYEPAGTLTYMRLLADGSSQRVERFGEAQWRIDLRFAPDLISDNRRPGSGQVLRARAKAPSILLSHRLGYMEGGFLYQSTDFSMEKRFWLGAFGYFDTKVKAGLVWNRVPYIRLYFPDASASLWMTEGTFNTMQPMEFVMDRYVSLFATYHLKGWILNRIPLINQLHLREVVGFSLLYGGLTPKNDPTAPNSEGLFVLPQGTTTLGGAPYMEYSIGIENILSFIRIDYVRRLSYTDNMSPRDRGMIRVGLRFTL